MTITLSKFSVGLFFGILALLLAPLGSMGPTDVFSAKVDDKMKEAIEEEVVEEEIEKEEVEKDAIKEMEDKVKLIREELEKKMEKRLVEMFKDEEMMDAVAKLKEAEEELAKNGGDTWFDRPLAPRSFGVRAPSFFEREFNPFRVRPLFFFDDFEDDAFFKERFFGEREDD